MKFRNYKDQQINKILNEAEVGVPIAKLSQQYGLIKVLSIKAIYGDLDVSKLKRLMKLEEENRQFLMLHFNSV